MNESNRNPFDIPPAAPAPSTNVPEMDLDLPKSRGDSKTIRIVVFFCFLGVVSCTILYFAFFKAPSTTPVITSGNTGAASSSSVNLREDQTNDFKRLMTALAEDRKKSRTENEAISTLLKQIADGQSATNKRVQRLEEVSQELISRGLVKENSQTDATALPEALQPLLAPAIGFCRKALAENGNYGWPALKASFTEWASTQSANLSADDIKRLHDAAQVPREPIADAHYDVIPPLTRRRLALRIQRDDLSGLVHMVWQDRSLLPPTTPGQYISLAILAGRAESARPGSPSVITDSGTGVQEYQDLVVPRDMRIGYVPCRSTDAVQIVALTIPYLTGGTSIADQDPLVATYGGVRARSIATTFLKRRSERVASLIAALVEEIQRQQQIPRPELSLGGMLDDKTKAFATAAIKGMILARAVREGVSEQPRLNTWAQEMATTFSQETLAGLDLNLTQRAYATIEARDMLSTILPPVVAEAFDKQFKSAVEKYGKELAAGDKQRFLTQAAVQAAAATIAFARATDQPSVEAVGSVLIRAVKITAAQVEAYAITRRQIEEDLIPAYAGLYEGGTRDWAANMASYVDTATQAIDASLAARANEEPVPDLAQRLATTGRVEADTALARLASIDSINRDIDRFAVASPLTLVKSARDHAFARVQQSINSTITKDVQVRQTYAISREAIAIAQGKRRVRTTPLTISPPAVAAPTASTTPAGTSTSISGKGEGVDQLEEPITVVSIKDTAPPKVRYVTIPAGSYAEARVLAGVVCELGEQRPEPMLLNLNYSWSGPAGTTLMMRDLRLVADCTAMGGAPRVRTKITTISYTLPDGTQLTMPCDGWAVDDIQGQGGIVGVWDWNLETVVPLGTANGLLSALTSLLQPTQQVTSVNTSVTIIDQEKRGAGEKLGQGAAEGLKETVGNHITKTLDNIKPAIFVQNNQPCTVALKQDIILPIPADQWNRVVEERTTLEPTGFVK